MLSTWLDILPGISHGAYTEPRRVQKVMIAKALSQDKTPAIFLDETHRLP